MGRGRKRLLAALLCVILSATAIIPEGFSVSAKQPERDGQTPASEIAGPEEIRTGPEDTEPEGLQIKPETSGPEEPQTGPEELQTDPEDQEKTKTETADSGTESSESLLETTEAETGETENDTEIRETVAAQEETESTEAEIISDNMLPAAPEQTGAGIHANTLIPFEIDGTDIYAGFGNASFYGVSKADITAPQYDPRMKAPEEMTSVKNQNPWGTCWAFATMALLENSMIRQGLSDNSIDLSERHLAYFSRNTGSDMLGNASDDRITSSPDNTYLMAGGNAYMSAIRLMNWQGAAIESAYPYSNASTAPEKIDASYAQDTAVLAHDFYFVPTKEASREEKIDAVKKLIADYGCVQWSYYDADPYFNDDTDAYYNPNGSSTNHAVTIVGWDDEFPAGHFGNSRYENVYKPEGDGAWIVKNSWGERFGENGYFYISYEDQSLGSGNPASVAVAAADTYDHNYFYGNTTYFSALRFGGAVRIAQVYQVKSDGESLAAVSVMLNSDKVDYRIQVYKNPQLEDGVVQDPESGEPLLETPVTGTTGYAGLYTIDLPETAAFAKGDYMAVVIGIPASKSINIDGTGADRAVSSSFQVLYENQTHLGQSFWFNGRKWIDTADPAQSASLYNFRINALTVDMDDVEPLAAPVFTPAPDTGILEEGQVITIKSSEGARIYYTLDGTTPTENSVRYREPFTVTKDVTVKAVAVRGEEISPVSEVSYRYYGMKLELAKADFELARNRVCKLQIVKRPALPEGAAATVSYETSNEKVATVTQDGLITGTGQGNAVITVKAADYKGNPVTAVCNVKVTEEEDIAGGSYEDLIWFIDQNGKLTVEGTGEFAPIRGAYDTIAYNAMAYDATSYNATAYNTTAGYRSGAGRAPWHPYAKTDILSAEINVTGMTDASGLFYECHRLQAVDLDGFDTSNVTNMAGMFAGCSDLNDPDLSGFDTSNVTDMRGMFQGNTRLQSLDLSHFDSGNVTDMTDMFGGCTQLAKIYTPCNVKYAVTLPAADGDIWYQPDGTAVSVLPEELDYSMLILKNKKPEVFCLIVRKTKTDYVCGEELGLDDLSVTYVNGKGVSAELTASSYTTNADEIDMSLPGTKRLVITYRDGETGKEIRAEIELKAVYILKEDSLSIRLSDENPEGECVYDGTPQTPALEVKLARTGTVLTEGTDYTAVYENNINAGTAFVTVTGKKDYIGTATGQFTIRKAAAPEGQTLALTFPCDKAQPARSLDVESRFTDYGEITDYRLSYTAGAADGREFFSETPYLDGGVLHYGTNAGKEGDQAQIIVEVSFSNYENAVLILNLKCMDERIIYTVTFDMSGHGAAIPPAVVSGKGGRIEEPVRPQAEGYRFLGWYKDGLCTEKWDFDADTVERNMTLYAGWLVAPVKTGMEFTELQVQEIKNQTYTGSPVKPAIQVYAPDQTGADIVLLKQGKDYTIKYHNNTNADTVQKTGGTCATGEEGDNGFTKDLPYVTITGKGNYQGTVYRNFHIDPVSIAAAGGEGGTEPAKGFTIKYSEQLTVNAKNGQKPFGSVKYKKAMKAGRDYSLRLSEAVYDQEKEIWTAGRELGTAGMGRETVTMPTIPAGAEGTFLLTVTGKGNYCGSVSKVVYVSDKARLMKNASVTLGKKQKKAEYTGQEILLNPGYYDVSAKKYYGFTKIGGQIVMDTANEADKEEVFTVKIGGKYLKYGEDYKVSYQDNQAVGTAVLILEGVGKYSGTKKLTFRITGTAFNAKNIRVDGLEDFLDYTGKALTQNGVLLKSTKDGAALTYRKDYTISYKNNLKKGTASMTFTAKPSSGYTGSFKKTFQIRPTELFAQGTERDTVTITAAPGAEQGTLEEGGENGGIEYTDNGMRFTGKVWYTKEGAKISDRIILKNKEGLTLKEGRDYTVSYGGNKTITKDGITPLPVMKIKGKGNYTGSLEIAFRIDKAPLEGNESLAVTSQAIAFDRTRADGYEYRPKVKAVDKKQALHTKKDYDVAYYHCTQTEVKNYLTALQEAAEGTVAQTETDGKRPYAVITAKEESGYEGRIRVDVTVYQTKLTENRLYVVISQEKEQLTYTGGQVRPEVTVYYGDAQAVKAAKRAGIREENTLVQAYGLKKLRNGSQSGQNAEGAAENAGDYTLAYGANVTAGKNKGSVTVSGTGLYGGSVTVKFTIVRKEVYTVI